MTGKVAALFTRTLRPWRLQSLVDLALAIHCELVHIRELLAQIHRLLGGAGNEAELQKLRQAVAGATQALDTEQENIDKIGR